MPSETSSAKTCVVCGQDCAGKPRVKDKTGRYFCKPCHEKAMSRATAKQAAPVAAAVAADDAADGFSGFDNAAILADLDTQPAMAVASGPQCGGCGMPMALGAVICTSCGFNTATGKGAKIKVTKEGSGAAGEVAAKAASVLWTQNPLAWVLGGLVGGAIGAAIWAGVAYQFNREIGWIAWGVGILTGLGVQAVARQYADVVSGVIAAVIALVAVIGGKFATASLVAEDFTKQIGTSIRATDQDALVRIATSIADDLESKGHVIDWPRGQSNETAVEQHHFPREVWSDATKKWRAMKPEEKTAFKTAMEEQVKAFVDAAGDEAVQEMVFSESFGLKDVLFLFLAVCSAYAVGSGAGLNSDD